MPPALSQEITEFYRVNTGMPVGPLVNASNSPAVTPGFGVEFNWGPEVLIRNRNYPNFPPNQTNFCADLVTSFVFSGAFTQTVRFSYRSSDGLPQSDFSVGNINFSSPSLNPDIFSGSGVNTSFVGPQGTTVNARACNTGTLNNFVRVRDGLSGPILDEYPDNINVDIPPYGLRLVLFNPQPVDNSQCQVEMTQYCCQMMAENSCESANGVLSILFNEAEQSCTWRCNDDDNGGDPGNGDGDGPGNGEEPGNGDGDNDSEGPNLSRIESLLEEILAAVGFDDSDIIAAIEVLQADIPDLDEVENLLQTIADKPDFDDDRIVQALDDLSVTADVDLSGLLDQAISTNQLLEDIFSDDSGSVPAPDDLDIADSFPGVSSDGSEITDFEHFRSSSRELLEAAGLDLDPRLSDLQLETINIDDRINDFQPWLDTQQCPDYLELHFMNRTFRLHFQPMCDVFGWIGIVVIFTAYFSVPFIVFGSRRS